MQSTSSLDICQSDMKIFSAPLQGYTDRVWREAHASLFGAVDAYFAPFMRVEKGVVRPRDVRDITCGERMHSITIPQILFRDINEFRILTDAAVAAGYTAVDLNLGCPFPPQVNHGRGAALLRNPSLLEDVRSDMTGRYGAIRFSVKMRLGVDDDAEWKQVLPVINAMPLESLTVHPRVARQQYGGELHMGQFHRLLSRSSHPVVYNGDILTPEDYARIVDAAPSLHGVMIGRGLLGRPTLAAEITGGMSVTPEERLDSLLKMHARIYECYSGVLCGDTQLLSKIKPYWDYALDIIPRKAYKAIRKSSAVASYLEAVRMIG